MPGGTDETIAPEFELWIARRVAQHQGEKAHGAALSLEECAAASRRCGWPDPEETDVKIVDFVRPNQCDNSGPNCWDVARSKDLWLVRDSKNVAGPVLQYSDSQWSELVALICDDSWPAWVRWVGDVAEVRAPGNDFTVLTFNADEMSAFADSVRAGQYAVNQS